MDAIFKAMGDPARRKILDALRQKDGQSLSELEPLLDMSRFGVMKHLGVLEEAGLIVTRREGRFKYHHLNALPLQQAIDRWIEPLLAKPAARATLDLKARLEGDTAMSDTPNFVMETFIKTTPDALWAALTEPAQMAAYHFMADDVQKDGDRYDYLLPGGALMLACKITEQSPPDRLVTTFEPNWEGGGAPSRVVYVISEEGDHCRLTLEHYDLTFPVVPGEGVADGWNRLFAGLKTYLETGEAAHFGETA